MFDIERIKKKAKEIKENILLITEYTGITEEEFSKDMRNIFTLRYLLLESIEGCAAICNHILTKFGKIALLDIQSVSKVWRKLEFSIPNLQQNL